MKNFKRFDYRRQYQSMTLEQLESCLSKKLDEQLFLMDDFTSAKWLKVTSYLRSKIESIKNKKP